MLKLEKALGKEMCDYIIFKVKQHFATLGKKITEESVSAFVESEIKKGKKGKIRAFMLEAMAAGC